MLSFFFKKKLNEKNQDLVKAYISNERQIVVFHKAGPFPSVAL